jgi:hypothetical protein
MFGSFRFWTFRRRAPRRAVPARARFRPAFEEFEGRFLPSVSITPFTDPASGAPVLRILGDARNNTVQVTDDSTTKSTTVVADGITRSFSQQFTFLDIELRDGNDELTFTLIGDYDGQQRSLLVDLGNGNNQFAFNRSEVQILNHSQVTLDVEGGNGNDFLDVHFGPIADSTVNVTANLFGGADTGLVQGVVTPGSISFKGGIRSSSVDVRVDLGTGGNDFRFNFGADLGKLDTFGPSTMNVSITGSDRAGDLDNVVFFADGEANSASTLNVDVQLKSGNDTFRGVFDADTFEIDDDDEASPFTGGAIHFTVDAGAGNDLLNMASIHQGHTIELTGLFDINLQGSQGRDTISVDFGGPGGFANDDEEFEQLAQNRSFRLRVDGGGDSDAIIATLANTSDADLGATFSYDVALRGGAGSDLMVFNGGNPLVGSDNGPSFGSAGAVLIDGGSGINFVAAFGNFPVEVFNAIEF